MHQCTNAIMQQWCVCRHPFPAGLHDAYVAALWAATTTVLDGHTHRQDGILIGGDSAGGNIAAVISTLARDGLNTHGQPASGSSHMIMSRPLFSKWRKIWI